MAESKKDMNFFRSQRTFAGIAVAFIVLLQPCKANKELPRSLAEMQSVSGIILDGTVEEVRSRPVPANRKSSSPMSDDYEVTFQVERIEKGHVRDQNVILVFTHTNDPGYEGDNPSVLKVGDRFRLFADKVESMGPPPVIRVRTVNAVRPEALTIGGQFASPVLLPATWWSIITGIVVVLGLLWLRVKNRK